MNFGLLTTNKLDTRDWRFAGVTGMQGPELNLSGDWTEYLPVKELQKRNGLETMACVSFSALNAIETLSNYLVQNWNKSDRFTAKESGTTKSGNYYAKVAECIRLQGLVDEIDWPFEGKTWEEFYKTIPDEIKAYGKGLLD
ncbi:MAG: hypothetical protein MN733_23625, partial [Nitrososphaera sp.]|nr:hypothetical protein [Nitrososphaera sp.]